jgi:uncharacterized OB-fold protein
MSYVGESSLGHSIFTSPEEGEPPQLVGSRCPTCGDTRFPARQLCPIDLSRADEYRFQGTGVIYEVVRVSLAPVGFVAPYWAGYVDLDEGVRVFAQVVASANGVAPASGDSVSLTVDAVRVDDGEPVLGPIFRKVSDADV